VNDQDEFAKLYAGLADALTAFLPAGVTVSVAARGCTARILPEAATQYAPDLIGSTSTVRSLPGLIVKLPMARLGWRLKEAALDALDNVQDSVSRVTEAPWPRAEAKPFARIADNLLTLGYRDDNGYSLTIAVMPTSVS
jgi:hypothetical protein